MGYASWRGVHAYSCVASLAAGSGLPQIGVQCTRHLARHAFCARSRHSASLRGFGCPCTDLPLSIVSSCQLSAPCVTVSAHAHARIGSTSSGEQRTPSHRWTIAVRRTGSLPQLRPSTVYAQALCLCSRSRSARRVRTEFIHSTARSVLALRMRTHARRRRQYWPCIAGPERFARQRADPHSLPLPESALWECHGLRALAHAHARRRRQQR